MRIIIAVLLGLLMGMSAPAGHNVTSADYDRCMARSDGIATKMHDCEDREIQRLERHLNAQYQTLMTSSPPPLATAWRGAQRAWVPYRKAECELASAPEQNGLGIGLWVDLANGCTMAMTTDRIKAFQAPVRFAPYHSPTYDTCIAKNGGRCADDEAKRLDGDLNATYRTLMAKIAKSDNGEKWRDSYSEALRHSERAWLSWRDAECALAAAVLGEGGKSSCRLSLLESRVSLLRRAEDDLNFVVK